jgi:hypothetical protein
MVLENHCGIRGVKIALSIGSNTRERNLLGDETSTDLEV